ncbi:MAG TPA: peptidoglycan-binding domain-containing protein [Candidatus Paceibacterota bacterium]|nr:peptidoglycan-binding domain-containing protein [Candidatus Paceibacterota bacterium]
MSFRKQFFSFFIIFCLTALVIPFFSSAQTLGQQTVFFVGSDYDYYSRNQLSAVLVYQTSKLNFYIDTNWWNALTPQMQAQVKAQLFYLASYFENYDYPKLVTTFGSEALPGHDGDSRIYVLFHPMQSKYLGYARFEDTLRASASNFSNQHEMVYLNPQILLNQPAQQLGYYLSHEVLHLISFNQKGIFINADDERWLAEARSDYLSTFLGYDNVYAGSILEQRVNAIRQNSNFSLLNFTGSSSDYAAVHLLAEYLVEKYGMNILVDSLHSKLTGIASINEALAKNGYSEDFNTVFKNWLIAMAFNDCQMGDLYCFTHPSLKNFKIYPYTNYLPDYGAASMTASNYLNLYGGTWIKLTGGKGDLTLTYEFPRDAQFYLPIVIVDQNNKKTIATYSVADGYRGTIKVPDFGRSNIALYLMPFVVNNSTGATLFKWEVTVGSPSQGSSNLADVLAERINQLKAQVASLMAQLQALQQAGAACSRFQNDLYYGLMNNNEVRCLQKMLLEKEPGIYPSGLITGNYLSLTQEAVRQYQQKYGLPATGYFGPLTRALANRQWFGY